MNKWERIPMLVGLALLLVTIAAGVQRVARDYMRCNAAGGTMVRDVCIKPGALIDLEGK